MRVSVNIATKNRAVECSILLSSLLRQTHQNFDVVIVDGSDVPSVNYKFFSDMVTRLRLDGHKVEIVPDSVRSGPCRARNIAVEKSSSDYILRIDDDSWLEPDYIERLVNVWEAVEKSCKVGAVGGLVPLLGAPDVKREMPPQPFFNMIMFDEEGNVSIQDMGGNHWLTPKRLWECHHIRSSFLFSRQAWKDAGGFDEALGHTGFREETIFCMKLRWAGYKLFTDLDALAWHLWCQGGGVRSPDYARGVAICEQYFKEFAKREFKKRGWP